MTKSCREIFGHVSDYLDGACGREESRRLRAHLSECAGCRREFEQWRQLQGELRGLPRVQVPPPAALQVRVRISQESHRHRAGRWRVWLDNAVRPLLIPSIAGVVTAVVFVGFVLCQGIPPVSNRPDVPLGFATPARVWELAPVDFNLGDQQVVVVTYVNARGRATSYKVLSGQHSPQLLNQLDRMVYFSLFRPATVFGRPANGEVVLSFRRITVRG